MKIKSLPTLTLDDYIQQETDRLKEFKSFWLSNSFDTIDFPPGMRAKAWNKQYDEWCWDEAWEVEYFKRAVEGTT